MAAAAISAVSGSNTGLAYWGTGNIQITGSTAQKAGGGSWSVFSDARIKKDVSTLTWGLDELREIRPVTYRYNGLARTDNDGRQYVGVIAQEIEKIFPSMVTTKKEKLRASDANETEIKVVDPSALTFVLINAVKQQQKIIDRQERRLAALEGTGDKSVAASLVGGGLGTCLALGLLPLGFVTLRRRRQTKAAS